MTRTTSHAAHDKKPAIHTELGPPSRIQTPDGIAFTLVPLDSIKPNPQNYNQHPDEQITSLKASLTRFGQVDPYIVKDAGDGTYLLAAGEGCTIAAGALLRDDPTRFAHLALAKIMIVPDWWDTTEVNGYMVANNLTATLSIPDDAGLLALLQAQHAAGHDLLSVGSDEETLRQLSQGWQETQPLPEPGDAATQVMAEQWGIVIECTNEAQQVMLLDRFQQEGITCRALVL